MRQYRRPAMPKELYKGFHLVKAEGIIFIYDSVGRFYGTAQTKEEAMRAIDRRAARRGTGHPRKNPGMRFRDLKIGQSFIFSSKLYSDKGAYIKVSPTTYIKIGSGERFRIHSPMIAVAPADVLKNPLTRAESANIRAEAAVHKRIATMSQRPIKKAYYQGMGAGMIDTAEQYAENPKYRIGGKIKVSGQWYEYLVKRAFNQYYYSFDYGETWARTKKEAFEKAKEKTPIENRKLQNNPRSVEVYENLLEVIAVKGPGHKCDAACKRARHTYRHKFTSRPRVFGNPDGSLTIK